MYKLSKKNTILIKNNSFLSKSKATLAQLVEQLIRNEQVIGSNPMGGSMIYKGKIKK